MEKHATTATTVVVCPIQMTYSGAIARGWMVTLLL
jgi:hypothetical protein